MEVTWLPAGPMARRWKGRGEGGRGAAEGVSSAGPGETEHPVGEGIDLTSNELVVKSAQRDAGRAVPATAYPVPVPRAASSGTGGPRAECQGYPAGRCSGVDARRGVGGGGAAWLAGAGASTPACCNATLAHAMPRLPSSPFGAQRGGHVGEARIVSGCPRSDSELSGSDLAPSVCEGRGRVRGQVLVSILVRSASRSARSQWPLGWCALAIRLAAWREEHVFLRRMRLQHAPIALRYPASTMAVHRLPGLCGRPALAGLMP